MTRTVIKNGATLDEIIAALKTMDPVEDVHMMVGVFIIILEAIQKELK